MNYSLFWRAAGSSFFCRSGHNG